MNRLPFGSFHATHFSPCQIQQWQLYLQQLSPPCPYSSHQVASQHTEEHQQEEPWHVDQHDYGDNYGDNYGNHVPLSKEAIAIFEFSEAYSIQRNQDTTEVNDEENSRQEVNSMLNISTSIHHDGIEAPATSLILLSPSLPLSATQSSSQQNTQLDRISTKQHFLNSAYLESCNQYQNTEQPPLVMWPVLPFRI